MKRSLCLYLAALLISAAAAQTAAQTSPKPLTIEAIFAEGGITGRPPENIQWTPDNKGVSYIQRDDAGEQGELWYVDAATGEKKLLISEVKITTLAPPLNRIKDEREKERITRYHVAAYVWSPDSRHLLFDSLGQLWLYSLDSGTAVQFTSEPEPSVDPKFSPDGSHVTYVRKHNLYSRPISGTGEKQLTRDKDENLLNGEVDWVYAEELAVRSNYFWSPDGKDITFLQTDEKQVPTYPLTDWLPNHARVEQEKYPQPGDPNPVVRIGVVGAEGGKTRWISLTDDPDTYIPRFGWIRDGFLWAELLNRKQDTLDLYFVDARSGKSRKVLTESASDAWVNVNDDLKMLKSSPSFTWTSWRDGHTHIYLYSFNQNDPLSADARLDLQLTKGDFEVLSVDGVDESGGAISFTCNKDDLRQGQLYSIKLDGSALTRISREEGVHAATFASDGKHFVDEFSATLVPLNLSLCTPGSPCHELWTSRGISDFTLIPPKFLAFKADDGTTLYGQLLLPAAGTTSDRIPLIVYVYGGPADQLVRNRWGGTRFLFHQMLAKEGFAVFTVDNRGTPGRDRKFQAAIRHQFGAIELKDQLAALDQLLPQVPQIDASRIAIWGWSNGGSMTLYALTHSDRFKTGISVAPVTDWRLYDSIYTERYLGLPKDDSQGYDSSSMPRVAGNLHGSLLLVHGSSDDNVHFQNSIQMIDALIKAGKQFDFMTYPGKTHGISGAEERAHLFHRIEDHFTLELK